MPKTKEKDNIEQIPWSFHPRVFTSLGAELVTNDLVALIELVKNSYDAFAHRVDVRFAEDKKTEKPVIEIQDDGQGMTRTTIIESWCVVGTPYRALEPSVKEGGNSRRVTGEKGLGRLSAARLGGSLRIYTKTLGKPCYRVDVDWNSMTKANNLSECKTTLQRVKSPERLGVHGTILQIRDLKTNWDFEDEDFPDLEAELARLVPPFKNKSDFQIFLAVPGKEQESVRIKPPQIISHPVYKLKGKVDEQGIAVLTYFYKGERQRRKISEKLDLRKEISSSSKEEPVACGPFSFELRVWDFDKDALLELKKRFDLKQKLNMIRKEISNSPFSGIALYRDDILVLPKMMGPKKNRRAAGQDWLGLSLRRVSRVGTRIGANQIIGYINICADANPGLRDTADRERLVDNSVSREFRKYLVRILKFLEEQRESDKIGEGHREPPLQDLFNVLRSLTFTKKMEDIEERKGSWEEIHQTIAANKKEIDSAVKEIQKRFYYYSRLASIGSLAMLLQHEVGQKVSVIAALNSYLRENEKEMFSLRFLQKKLHLSEIAARSLQRLADIFSPLASRTFGTHRRNSIVEEIAGDVAKWHQKEIKKNQIKFNVSSDGTTKVSVDPGELVPIFDNLMTNALYWLRQASENERRIIIEIFSNDMTGKADIKFHDSGPGIEDGLEEKIFWPGITKKKDGIGMGLTVASELVAQRGGKMFLIKPGDLDGATFGFDLPLVRRKR